MRPSLLVVFVLLALCSCIHAGQIVKKSIDFGPANQEQVIMNGGLETLGDAGFEGWTGWDRGYEVDANVKHGGEFSARCTNATGEEHRGLTWTAELNQKVAAPIVAECWSKAQDVSGGPDVDYSLYLDLEYVDGTPLWGQISVFKTETHDWQKRRVTVVPAKPIKSVQVHGIFRRHTGTAWFDDFTLYELKLPEGIHQFDSVPVTAGRSTDLSVSSAPGSDISAGLFVRDVARKSDFVQIQMSPPPADGPPANVLAGRDEELQLALRAEYRKVGDALRIDGVITDLSGEDRAVTVYCSRLADAVGWRWHDDQRASSVIGPGEKYANFVSIGAGANRMASRYPLACVSGNERGMVIGAPLDVPRLYRFGYDADALELYGAVDLGLSSATEKFPSQASFSFVLYDTDPQWGFRSALQTYYSLFPQCFTKRNEREGIWMPFTDIATVEGFEDFGFQFQEGAPNVPFDEQHGIYSFVYVEPMSHWLTMPQEMERTNERALALVREKAEAGDLQSQATLSSAIEGTDHEWVGGIIVAPWCDGALYQLNPSPNVEPAQEGMLTQFDHEWRTISNAVERAGVQRGAWRGWGKGYDIEPGAGRDGSAAARSQRGLNDPDGGASQTVVLSQEEARPLVARVWTKAADVTGGTDNNYCLYIDLKYIDGTDGWGFVVEAQPGTHDWQLLEQTITPAKPVRALSYHLLFRRPHEGTVWYDDAFLGEQGSDKNLLESAGFEPQTIDNSIKARLDGTYIDSLEMAASTLNYRREHFAQTETPLVFDDEGVVCQMGIFNTVEFAKEAAKRMWADDRMMFANSTPIRFPWAAAWLDVMGIETDWGPSGQYRPNPDSTMNYWRAVCYQRPYLLLLNTVYEDFKPEWVELYFKRCAAYGIFPSFFSHNAADDPYWQRPNLYNRDRPLFKKYMPVIRALSAAGWEPITSARSSNEKVYLERFGHAGETLYLTAFNDSQETQQTELTLDVEALGIAGDSARLLNVFTGAKRQVPQNGVVKLDIGPEDVVVLQVTNE